MRLRIPLTAAVMAIALALTSCGGGGGGGSKALSSTGRAVQNVQRLSILSMGKGGIAIAPFMLTGPGGGGGGTTGSTTGSGGGFGGGGTCSIGFFFRGFGGPAGHAATLMKSRAGRDEGSTTGSGGGGPGSDFYFDEWLQLWVSVEWSNTSYTTTFFLDEARIQPAGHVASTFTGDWELFPQTYHNEYEFTAGLLAGSHGVYDCTQNSLFEGSMSYEDTYADGSHDSGQSSWSSELSSWHSRWDGPNNEGWFEDTGIWSSDGTGTYTCSNSEGWASTWHYNADWSGSAHFEGPDPKLPAEMTWTADGHYHITYADGTSESWTWDDFWGDVEEGGTTGTGGFGP